MDVSKYWNIFQCILKSIGSDGIDPAESITVLLSLFQDILLKLDLSTPVVNFIMSFINFAWRAYELVRSVMYSSQPLQY